MTPPELAAQRFGAAVMLGAALGIGYCFLHPPCPRRWPGDLCFMILALRIWAELAFRICRGDMRPAYLGGLAAGAWATIALFGSIIARFWNILAIPAKKISKITKKIVCIWRKMGYNKG